MVAGGAVTLAFKLMVDFPDGLPKEKQSADEEHEVFAADGKLSGNDGWIALVGWSLLKRPWDAEDWFLQAQNNSEEQQKDNPGKHGQHEPLFAGLLLLLLGQFAGEDGNEDDVVHAEDDLQSDQGEQTDPCCTAGRPGKIEKLSESVHWRW